MDHKREIFDLLLISFLMLFAELVFIRYITSNIYLLSYYKNAILLAIFLGIGTGFMISGEKRNYIEFLPLATLVLLYLIINFNNYLRIDIDFASRGEAIWPEFWANSKARSVPMLGVLAVFYIIIALYFVPFGQETARRMTTLKPLFAYSVNIAGAIAGIVVFEVLGRFWIKPIVWFAIILVPLLWLQRRYATRISFLINLFALLASLFLLFSSQTANEFWSPYSKIKIYPFSPSLDQGFISTTNGNPQVGCINFDYNYNGILKPSVDEGKAIYGMPYLFRSPKRVLIAGAGAGNEVVMAIRHKDVTSVDAVELDPVFAELAKAVNPHKPFSDDRVRVHIDDARAFFQKTALKYDLIVIGFLDSQYHLSHMSNIRTENFVYTYESITRTKEMLSENGLLQLNYNAGPRMDMRAKLYYILKKVYGDDVAVYTRAKPTTGNISFIAGPGLRAIKNREIPGFILHTVNLQPGYETSIPSDDWPFLYLSGKQLPREYWNMFIFIPLISLIFIKTVGKASAGFNLKYFFLGAGFMLLETKSITSYALLFGSTVSVVSIVIGSILCAILFANIIVESGVFKSVKTGYVLILATLILMYFTPPGIMLTYGLTLKLIVSGLLIAAPIFFSAIVFAFSIMKSDKIAVDLGSNIFGAVMGGLLEYSSMAFGFKSLYILSFVMYLLAFMLHLREKGNVEQGNIKIERTVNL